MKLSELISFQNRLNALSVDEIKSLAHSKLDIIMHLITNESSVSTLTSPFVEQLESTQHNVYNAFDNFDEKLNEVRQVIQKQIAEQERYWFQESYRLFEEAEVCETTNQILYGRKITGNKNEYTLQAEETLRSKISYYASWKWPGLIIRPGTEDFVESMVGCDPLYIVDRDYDLLQPCLDRFPKLYQNRLRTYTTNDWREDPILERIPNDQFGVCLAYKVFDYRPLEVIRRYLIEIYQKLKPGGALLMTFNDCDKDKAVMLVEQFSTSYTPGYLVKDLASNIGFELMYEWSDDGPSTWVELRKPGELKSLRGGQVIAKVHDFAEYQNDIDFIKRKHYNKKEIKQIRNRAIRYGANEEVVKNLSVVELIELIDDLYPAYEERLRLEKEEAKRQEEEQQRIRLENLYQEARSYGIDPLAIKTEIEIHEQIAIKIDEIKKQELATLRQRALELQAGDPNLIKYGYSAHKLKELIKEKENK